MIKAVAIAAFVLMPVGTHAALAAVGTGLVCVAPSYEIDAGKPLQDIAALEFYFDAGNPLDSYSVPFKRIQSNAGADGNIQNAYSVGDIASIGATIDFAGSPATPHVFTVVALAKVLTSVAPNDDETEFLADAVPGVVCYSVSIAGLSP